MAVFQIRAGAFVPEKKNELQVKPRVLTDLGGFESNVACFLNWSFACKVVGDVFASQSRPKDVSQLAIKVSPKVESLSALMSCTFNRRTSDGTLLHTPSESMPHPMFRW